MMPLWPSSILLILSVCGGRAGGSDHVDSHHLRQELEKCQNKLLKHTMDQLSDTAAAGLMGRTLGGIFGGGHGEDSRQHLRSLTSSLLATLQLDPEHHHHSSSSSSSKRLEKGLTFNIASQDLLVLRRFVLYNEGKSAEIQAIIQSSLRVRETWLRSDLLRGLGSSAGGHTPSHMKPKYALLIMGCCVVCLLVLVVYLRVRVWQLVLPLLLYIYLHVWIGEYYTAVARKEAVLAKLGPNLVNCRLERTGYVNAISDFFSGLWNDKTDPCEEYYIATMVDPFFEVSPIEVFNKILYRLMAVLGGVGAALGNFYTNLLAPLPLLWKVPILALATVLCIVLMLVCGRYSITSIFFTIGPDRRKKTKPVLTTCASCPSQLTAQQSAAAAAAVDQLPPPTTAAAAFVEPPQLPSPASSPALLAPYPPPPPSPGGETTVSAAAATTGDSMPRPRQGWKFLMRN